MSLNGYEIIGKLGEGVNGVVYLAIDVEDHSEVAIKKLPYNEEATNEIEIHYKMNHLSFIPKLHEFFIAEDNDIRGPRFPTMKLVDGEPVYLVMDLIEGESMYQIIRSDNDWSLNWIMMYQVLLLVQELHQAGFYHGDLHSNNLIWDTKKMWLIDFDSAGELHVTRSTTVLPDNWHETRDYSELTPEEQDIVNLREELLTIFDSDEIYVLIGDEENEGDIDLQRCLELCEFVVSTPCENLDQDGKYVTDSEYIRRIIEEYHRIDSI